MTTLLSFLGRSVIVEKAGEKSKYRTANYCFPSGEIHTEKYFGLALVKKVKPGTLIVLGTSSSSWDVFFDDIGSESEEMLSLVEAVQEKRVTDQMLLGQAGLLADLLGMQASQVYCRIIPMAQTSEDQIAIMETIADVLPKNDDIVMDVTHGFRHLPLLSLVAARYLEYVNGLSVKSIYYGALDMTQDEKTPVLELTGLLRMLEWVDAMTAYDRTGNYALFAPLLRKEGLSDSEAVNLEKASFFEQSFNVAGSRDRLRSVRTAVQSALSSPMGKLIWPLLEQRLSWIDARSLENQELALAKSYLDRGDYLRAAALMQESFVTYSIVQSGGNPIQYKERKKELKDLREKHAFLGILSELRNSMAHGQRAKGGETKKLLKNPDELSKRLKRIHKEIDSVMHNDGH